MTSRTELRQFIAGSPWFADAPDDVLDRLTDAASIKQYATGSFIWTTGQITNEVFGLVSGRVRICMTGPMGEEYALIDWEPGAWMGDQPPGTKVPNKLEVRVLAPSDMLVISGQVLREVGESWPILYRNLFSANRINTHGLYEILDAVLFYPLRARVAGRVLVLIEEHGHRSDEGVLLDIKLSQNDFARLARGSRQRVNQIFRDWEKKGLVVARGEYLLIKDIKGLEGEMVPFD